MFKEIKINLENKEREKIKNNDQSDLENKIKMKY